MGAAVAQASGSAGQLAAGKTGKAASGHRPYPESWNWRGSFLLEMPKAFRAAVLLGGRVGGLPRLTLYAMHQQGNDQPMNRPGNTLGRAVRQLAERNTPAGQDWFRGQRAAAVQCAGHRRRSPEIDHHLRGMVKLLSAAKDGGIRWTIRNGQTCMVQCADPRYAQTPANVRLRWGQDLYRDPKPAPDEKEKEN